MPFSDAIKKVEEQLRVVSLNVLIWGPGSGDPGYQKRLQIRNALCSHFMAANVWFSEEIESVPDKLDLSVHERELLSLAVADVCVVLATTPGSLAEIASFADGPIRRKLLVLSPQGQEPKSLVATILEQTGNHMTYTVDEYSSCAVVQRVIARVRQIALAKLLMLSV